MTEPRDGHGSGTAEREERTERAIGVAFALSAAAAIALAVVFARGGHPQAEGALLGVSLCSLGWAMAAWGKYLLPHGPYVQKRHPMDEEEVAPEPVSRLVDPETGEAATGPEPEPDGLPEVFGRRPFLSKMLVGTMGALGLAALFPIRSLGPNPGRDLFRTDWRAGSRLVTEEGRLVRLGELEVGSVLTVFPEGHVGSADSQTLLIRAQDDDMVTRPGREAWAPEGHVAYSKVCTHAGCPVGLYQVATKELLCPCHQSLFDVIDGARPVFGPATRSLPQLALEVDDEGYLRAQGDYHEPIGPGFWERP
ncbi:MAG: Rieske 2Fe-2S domain-containing protein [Acidimicrobiales bacterium]